MANRPVFIPDPQNGVVREVMIDFTWVPGMAKSQAQKCIASLHDAAMKQENLGSILEISSKSEERIGVQLSAFNLHLKSSECRSPLECVYQSSKKFEHGGPYKDLLRGTPIDAKRDPRLKTSGRLTCFIYDNTQWELEPKTAYYDWLYLIALEQNAELANHIQVRDAFSDIAFNPKKSISCQARSAALYCLLRKTSRLKDALNDQECFLLEHAKAFANIPNSNQDDPQLRMNF